MQFIDYYIFKAKIDLAKINFDKNYINNYFTIFIINKSKIFLFINNKKLFIILIKNFINNII